MKVFLKIDGSKKVAFDIQHAVNLLNIPRNGGWQVATKVDQKKIDAFINGSNEEE